MAYQNEGGMPYDNPNQHHDQPQGAGQSDFTGTAGRAGDLLRCSILRLPGRRLHHHRPEGNIEITNSDAVKILMPFFIEQGWHTAEATEEPVEPAADSETAEAPAEAAAENIVDPERVTGIDDCTISLPADMTVAQITNLVHMLYSEQRLLNKAAMDGRLTIPESHHTPDEYTPETPEAFADLLNDFKALGELAGMSYENGVVSMDFPHDDAHPEHGITYAGLVERIIHAAKESTRIKAEINTSENEKYYMRAWLLRLGYGGADLKAERRLLLRNLKGHSAFPTDAAAESTRKSTRHCAGQAVRSMRHMRLRQKRSRKAVFRMNERIQKRLDG